MSLFRYFNEKTDADGEKLWWPGGPDGFPFRGPKPPSTKQEEYDNLSPTGKVRCRIFYLDKPEDLADYIKTREKCTNGLYIQLDRDRQWDQEASNYRVFMEWVELGYDLPPPTSVLSPSGTTQPYDAVKNAARESNATTIPYHKLAGVPSTW